MPTDEERAAFKRSEREAAAAIMAGDRYCPDPSVHAAPRPLDVERLVDAANAVLYAARKRPVTQEEERALALLDEAADIVGARLGSQEEGAENG